MLDGDENKGGGTRIQCCINGLDRSVSTEWREVVFTLRLLRLVINVALVRTFLFAVKNVFYI